MTCYNTSASAEAYQGQISCMLVSNFGWLCIVPAQMLLLTVLLAIARTPVFQSLSHVWTLSWTLIKQQLFKLSVSRSILLQPDMFTGLHGDSNFIIIF